MNTTTETDISGLRCYDKVVDAVTYTVPRGITREARGRVWIVRVLKNKEPLVHARFTDARFGGTRRALDAAIIHLLHSGLARRSEDVLSLNERAVVHWRKRSGVGLCAVAYISRTAEDRVHAGRGETLFLATFRRIASGRGMDKFRGKLIEVLELAYALKHDGEKAPYVEQKKLRREADKVLESEAFERFLEAGQRKVDQIVVTEYLDAVEPP
jgi:hypothetical protein